MIRITKSDARELFAALRVLKALGSEEELRKKSGELAEALPRREGSKRQWHIAAQFTRLEELAQEIASELLGARPDNTAELQDTVLEKLADIFSKRIYASQQLSLQDLKNIRDKLLRPEEYQHLISQLNGDSAAVPGCAMCNRAFQRGEMATYQKVADPGGNSTYRFVCSGCMTPTYTACTAKKGCAKLVGISNVVKKRLVHNCGGHNKKRKGIEVKKENAGAPVDEDNIFADLENDILDIDNEAPPAVQLFGGDRQVIVPPRAAQGVAAARIFDDNAVLRQLRNQLGNLPGR